MQARERCRGTASHSDARPRSESAPSFHIRRRNPTSFSRSRVLAALAAAALIGALTFAGVGQAEPAATAIAMHGAPALPADFAALPYANPDAPKGGVLRLAYLGAFDSLNPFNVKALTTAEGLGGHVFETLMARSHDEPFTLYGLIAETIETDAARDYVTFRLNPRAHFSDGEPVTAEDVRFSFELLRAKGRPQQRAAYALVKSVDDAGRADHPLRPRRRRRPRTAVVPGSHARAVAPSHRRRAF